MWISVKQASYPELRVSGAMFVASCLGAPVCLAVGLKLGMFSAIGGAIMGYTTGKMLEKHGYALIFTEF